MTIISTKPTFPVISYSTFRTLFDNGATVTYAALSQGYVINCFLNSYPFSCFARLPTEISDFENNILSFAVQGETMADAEALLLVAPKISGVSAVIKEEVTRYDVQENVIYIGTAKSESLSSEAVWTIQKITLVNGNPTYKQFTGLVSAVWDNRTTETYY